MRFSLIFLISLLLAGPINAFAQVNSNSFGIHLTGPIDTVPPTTPTLLSADPIASTQIDIAWTASSDDYGVDGYVIYRDGAPIATSTLITYSDTGLSASTTYLYEVKAFDSALNYSTTSNSLSTTTLAAPVSVAATSSEASEGTVAKVIIKEFEIEEGFSTTSLSLRTAHPARLEVRWGRTTAYELGYVVRSVYSVDHSIMLTDLEPGTKYQYEIIGYTPFGAESVIKQGSFVTLQESYYSAPANVSQFQAIGNGSNVNLSWQLPVFEDFSHVRIVRSHLGFPEHPQDGAIVYQGKGTEVFEVDILDQYSPVYYTAFVYDKFGKVSSGAVTLVYSTTKNDPTTGVIEVPVSVDKATSSINFDRVTVDMKMPQSGDITVIQMGKTFTLLDNQISLDSDTEFIISVPYNSVAGNLKSIIATILDPTDTRKAFSFLLRINHDQTAYQATIAPIRAIGESQIKLEIYDYEAFVVATYQAPLTLSQHGVAAETVVFPDVLLSHRFLVWASGLILIALLIGLFLFVLHRGLDEDKE